ncbi:MAG: recombinase family protein, partial [bacterium]|nr:recombinase family protein [bacterium]
MSRMMREYHVRICERLGVKFPGPTRRRIFQEKRSGARADRPELRRMLEHLREGDTLVVWRLDRLARSTRDLLDLAETIAAGGAGLKSLGEPWADTTTPAGKMVLTVFAGIAEFERALIRERTDAGRIAAKKRGVRFGRPPKLTPEQGELARRLADEGQPVPQITRTFGVHETRIHRCLAAMEGHGRPCPQNLVEGTPPGLAAVVTLQSCSVTTQTRYPI